MPGPDAASVLVVEDEASIAAGLCDVLAYRGFAPVSVARGDEAFAKAEAINPALVLLDVMLPGLSGFEVCEQLRARWPTLPVLMLTARGSEDDILRGFRAGCDDYVTKPFSVAELLARVEALLRRSGSVTTDRLTLGPWEIDGTALRAIREGREVALSRREFELLATLRREAGRIVSRRALLRELWGFASPDRVETRTVDMHIAKLRKKLAPDGARLIETVRGEGYRLGVTL